MNDPQKFYISSTEMASGGDPNLATDNGEPVPEDNQNATKKIAGERERRTLGKKFREKLSKKLCPINREEIPIFTIFINNLSTNETGPLPLCTFSVMGLSMCSSIFSESSPLRSKSGIINELSGFPNSVPTVRCSVTSSNWHGHTGHAYCIWFVGKH